MGGDYRKIDYIDLFDHAPVGYMVLDADGRIEKINQTGAALLGSEASGLTGAPFLAWVMEQDKAAFLAHQQKLGTTEAPISQELCVRNCQGRILPIRLDSMPEYAGTTGKPACRCVMIDLSDSAYDIEMNVPAGGKGRASDQVIHIVNGDPSFLSVLEDSLSSSGLRVKTYIGAGALLKYLRPDQPGCLISDLAMPDMDGLRLQQELKLRRIRLPIIFISKHCAIRQAVTALKAGAVDLLEKPVSEQSLLSSVQQALSKDTAERKMARERSLVQQRLLTLTPREQEVFTLIVEDLPNKEIARRLEISPRTVEHHREHVMMKMQAHSVAELITMAVLGGIRELHL